MDPVRLAAATTRPAAASATIAAPALEEGGVRARVQRLRHGHRRGRHARGANQEAHRRQQGRRSTGRVPHRPRMRGIMSMATISQATERPQNAPIVRGA